MFGCCTEVAQKKAEGTIYYDGDSPATPSVGVVKKKERKKKEEEEEGEKEEEEKQVQHGSGVKEREHSCVL
ncbi:hypothetical protein RJT34_33162 [Clitoria ternatea]|uniref:Uncharacterized protein n=1 Tax=Clitoria ternatea TaxID=43366 RepID=A0AAN9EXS3_CLITE